MTLIGLSASLVLQQSGSLPLIGVLLAAAVWNAGLSLLVYLGRSMGEIKTLIVISDLVIANLLNYFAGLAGGSIIWAGLLPVFTAAFYFESRNLWLLILASFLSLGGQAFIFHDPADAIITIILAGLLFAGVGFAVYNLRGNIARRVTSFQVNRVKPQGVAKPTNTRHQKAVYKLVSTLSATLNYQRVLDTALDVSSTALSTSTETVEPLISAVLLYSDDEGTNGPILQVGSARRFTQADLRVALEGRQGLLGRAIDEAEALVSTDIDADPELSRIIALRSCRSALCIPLRTGLDTYGVMLFGHQDAGYFTTEKREVLDIIGSQATIAIQNARLYHDLELEKERITQIQEEARAKLARDLHDGPTQSVAALAMRVNFARRMMERDKDKAMEELVKIEDLARRTTQEIRHMLFTLRPLVLESQGLTVALEAMADKMKETFNQRVLVAVDETIVDQIEMNKQSAIFFIAEEAVNNARKHAKAENVWVSLRAIDQELVLLEIRDDGVGFNPETVRRSYDKRDSLGMINMRERAELISGVLRINSSEGKGTRVQVGIPLSEAAADRLSRRKPG
jgi:signal transduction histidine kinase